MLFRIHIASKKQIKKHGIILVVGNDLVQDELGTHIVEIGFWKRKDTLNIPKCETIIQKKYNDIFEKPIPISNEPYYYYRDMIRELENGSVEDKYNRINRGKYSRLLEVTKYENG